MHKMRLVLKDCATGEITHGTVDDAPGDNTVVYIEAIVVGDGDTIAVIDEAEYGDDLVFKVGWHVSIDDRRYEILEVGE